MKGNLDIQRALDSTRKEPARWGDEGGKEGEHRQLHRIGVKGIHKDPRKEEGARSTTKKTLGCEGRERGQA